MYPYYPVTGNPLIDSLYARPDQVIFQMRYSWVLNVALLGFIMAFVGGFNVG